MKRINEVQLPVPVMLKEIVAAFLIYVGSHCGHAIYVYCITMYALQKCLPPKVGDKTQGVLIHFKKYSDVL